VLAAAGAAVAGLVILGIEALIWPARAAAAYLAAWDFGVSAAVGCLVFVMINHVARSTWYVPLRRIHEAAATTLPLFAVLFVPIALSLRTLFPWTRPERLEPEAQAMVLHAHAWFQPAFFVGRSFFYLATWCALALAIRHASVRQDDDGRYEHTATQRWLSAAGTPVIAITLTLAAFDWFMSVVPGWTSTMHGLYVFAAGFSGAISVACIGAWGLRRAGRLPPAVGPSHFLAIGRVLLVSVILWGYLAFATLLLVWIADLPRENRFYAERVADGWAFVSGALLFGHFVIPFLVLLSRQVKLRPGALAAIAAWILVFHALDSYWLVVPSLAGHPAALDVGAFLAIAGLAGLAGAWSFSAVRPIPPRDPALARALRYVSQ
jgi:hypothetical protein